MLLPAVVFAETLTFHHTVNIPAPYRTGKNDAYVLAFSQAKTAVLKEASNYLSGLKEIQKKGPKKGIDESDILAVAAALFRIDGMPEESNAAIVS